MAWPNANGFANHENDCNKHKRRNTFLSRPPHFQIKEERVKKNVDHFFLEASRVNNNITQLIRFPVNKERNAREEASDVYRTDALK